MKFNTVKEYLDYLNSLPLDEHILKSQDKNLIESIDSKNNLIIHHHDCSFEEWKKAEGCRTLTEILSEFHKEIKHKY